MSTTTVISAFTAHHNVRIRRTRVWLSFNAFNKCCVSCGVHDIARTADWRPDKPKRQLRSSAFGLLLRVLNSLGESLLRDAWLL